MSAITALRLIDYRSYSGLDATFRPGAVVLFGANGAGKTNLLEALSLLSPGRGLRRAAIDTLARVEGGATAQAWGVTATVETSSQPDPIRLSVGQVPEQPRRRAIRLDGRAATGADMARLISLMWLTPAQDRLFTGPASDRRKFIDRFALAVEPAHGSHASRFEKARTERNRLLGESITDRAWYAAIEADLAKYGTAVAHARVQTVQALQSQISARETVFPQSLIGLDGTLENAFSDGADAETVETSYRAQLAEQRSIALRAGRTLIGPHRTELHVTHAAKAMPAGLCSTGEQKALLIGLVLAHARAQMQSETPRRPILLLDEVAAHLDAERRAALAEELLDLELQVFLTGTDAALFSDFGARAQHLRVADGALHETD